MRKYLMKAPGGIETALMAAFSTARNGGCDRQIAACGNSTYGEPNPARSASRCPAFHLA
jgi:hypothetical protein